MNLTLIFKNFHSWPSQKGKGHSPEKIKLWPPLRHNFAEYFAVSVPRKMAFCFKYFPAKFHFVLSYSLFCIFSHEISPCLTSDFQEYTGPRMLPSFTFLFYSLFSRSFYLMSLLLRIPVGGKKQADLFSRT